MPEEEYVWLPRSSLLSFEELDRLAGIFIGLGTTRVRLTGGEPLLRHDLPTLVRMLSARTGLGDLALTTNGTLLGTHAAALREAGLGRITVSLDTLRADRMRAFARTDRLPDVLAGIATARGLGFRSIKVNSVIVRSFNADEVLDLLEFARERGLELRYIEYMDVGGATRWNPEEVVSRAELLETIRARFGRPEPIGDPDHPNAPAERFRLPDGTTFGIIASVTAPFCGSCDRSRVTADGTWFTCLYGERGVDLRELLRNGADDATISARIAEVWSQRTDRGAEHRLRLGERGALYQVEGLRQDPRREMHTRGG
jgi:cyclic pyranopterin phosphate synthase